MHIVTHIDDNGRNAGFVFNSKRAAERWSKALMDQGVTAHCIYATDARTVPELYAELNEQGYCAYPLRKTEPHKAHWRATHRFFTRWGA